MVTTEKTVKALLDTYKTTYAEDMGIQVKDRPDELFQLFCAALLFRPGVSPDTAARAARALFEAGWTNPDSMAHAPVEERINVLGQAAEGIYDKSTALRLDEDAKLLMKKYHGDLRVLRIDAGEDPKQEREMLKEFRGIEDQGVDMFFREAQYIWPEHFPFADEKVLVPAEKLGLPTQAGKLKNYVIRENYIKLVDALVKTETDNNYEEIHHRAKAA